MDVLAGESSKLFLFDLFSSVLSLLPKKLEYGDEVTCVAVVGE